MSAELVASAHKTVHISLRARLGFDVAILIERAFAEFAPAAWQYSPRSAALSRVNFFTSGWQKFPTELFHERAGRRQIRKTPAKIDLAFSNNSPSMANLNFSRHVKVHYPAAQFDVQFIINDGN
jgi:hypothetical protein